MQNAAIERLGELQDPGGGWPAHPGGPARAEATALALLALRSHPESGTAVARGIEWLTARQLENGAWPAGDDAAEPNWATSLAVLCLARFEAGFEAARSGRDWLLDQRGRGVGAGWVRALLRLFGLEPDVGEVELDPTLTGWPWTEDTFSWVEPTCYAIFALKALARAEGASARSGPWADRIDEAEHLLLDRQCVDGGWNYGNVRVLGHVLPSYPEVTGLVLLALADRPELEAVERGIAALAAPRPAAASPLALALRTLALDAHRRSSGSAREALAGSLDPARERRVRTLAWAALALHGDADPLGVRDG